MSKSLWDPAWIQEHVLTLTTRSFRMVETQHIAATMRLVDSADEQDLLEQMLESNKPPLPAQALGLRSYSL
jgi:hypothetical protein